MKKNYRALAAIAALALGGVSQAAPVKVSETQKLSDKQEIVVQKKKQTKEISFDGFGGIVNSNYFAGTPPKQYGQYLQRIGRQKWTKSNNK